MKNIFILILILFILPTDLLAIDKGTLAFKDATQEARYQHLIEELRCVVCKNQSLADSNAELAQDLRDQVRAMIVEGKQDQEITEFLVSRYGEFVLYNPPMQPRNYLLWLGPLLLLLLALVALFYFVYRHAKTTASATQLSDEEQKKIQQLLGE